MLSELCRRVRREYGTPRNYRRLWNCPKLRADCASTWTMRSTVHYSPFLPGSRCCWRDLMT